MHEANVVATELARNIRQKASSQSIRMLLAITLAVLLFVIIFHRFSSRSVYADCAFRIPEVAQGPETQGDTYRLENCVRLEKVTTNSARTLGLSGRRSIDKEEGMLFDFGQSGEYCMWMKDMHFSLDILWLNDQKEIVYIIEDVTPDTYPKSFCGPELASYVVEVNQGIVRAADLHLGQRLKF